MDNVPAQLAPVASSLEELQRRITQIAEEASGRRDDIARDLYEVERSLATAQRRLERLVARLR